MTAYFMDKNIQLAARLAARWRSINMAVTFAGKRHGGQTGLVTPAR